MRKDMQKVLVDCHRGGSRFSKMPHPQKKSWDDYVNKEGMRRPYGYETKSQCDNWGALRRWAEKQVGRHWDDVWSDVCAVSDARSTMGRHLRGHVKDVIELDSWIDKKGRVWIGKYYSYLADRGTYGHPEIYVDPRDKIVKKTKVIPYVVRKPEVLKEKVVNTKPKRPVYYDSVIPYGPAF